MWNAPGEANSELSSLERKQKTMLWGMAGESWKRIENLTTTTRETKTSDMVFAQRINVSINRANKTIPLDWGGVGVEGAGGHWRHTVNVEHIMTKEIWPQRKKGRQGHPNFFIYHSLIHPTNFYQEALCAKHCVRTMNIKVNKNILV